MKEVDVGGGKFLGMRRFSPISPQLTRKNSIKKVTSKKKLHVVLNPIFAHFQTFIQIFRDLVKALKPEYSIKSECYDKC